MTLILALANPDQCIQLSDRRLSANNQPVDDESNKAGILICADARFLFGFAGIARADTFRTHQWILDTIFQCGPPDYTAFNTLKRFADRATRDFTSIAPLRSLPATQKRISAIFTGFLDFHEPPLAVCGLVTNYQDYTNRCESSQAWNEFRFLHTSERRPFEEPFTFIQAIGAWQSMNRADEGVLRDLLRQRKPSNAIIAKGVDLMRTIAERDIANRTIGKQMTSICLKRDRGSDVGVDYHTNVISDRGYLPSLIVNMDETRHWVLLDPSYHMREPNGPTIPLFPKVPSKTPCPCGSGKKYKHCHGK